tara:strand:+ start:770 stop:952 length:183 start_codon:yes stop_codon:yes gene_type:complete
MKCIGAHVNYRRLSGTHTLPILKMGEYRKLFEMRSFNRYFITQFFDKVMILDFSEFWKCG